MAVIEQSPTPMDSGGFELAKQLEGLEAELEPVTADQFSANADDIFATIQGAVEDGQPRAEGYKRATEAYVTNESTPALREQAQILLAAPLAHKVSQKLEGINQEMKQGRTKELSEERRRLVSDILVYNHLLRNFVYDNHGEITADQVQNWLERASGGEAGWARGMVAGFAGEVAIARLATRVSEIDSIKLSTAEEDRKGVDMIAQTSGGRQVPIDVKTGGQVGVDLTSSETGGRVEVGVSRDEIAKPGLTKCRNGAERIMTGFEIHPDHEAAVVSRIRSAVFH